MPCDFIYASAAATFRFPEALWGTVGAKQRLPRRIAVARAKDLLLIGRTLDAAEALAVGLVQRLLPREQVESQVLAVAKATAKAPPQALRLVKRAVDLGAKTDLAGIAVERLAIDLGLAGGEWQAGVQRFNAARDQWVSLARPRPGESAAGDADIALPISMVFRLRRVAFSRLAG